MAAEASPDAAAEAARVAKIWEWWRGTLQSPKSVLAPMVDQVGPLTPPP